MAKKKKATTKMVSLKSALNAYNANMSQMSQQIANMSAQNVANTQNAIVSQAASNAFNAEQAQINRDYQTFMSNTAHQREVADLQAAGLSPVLSANAGASTPGGAQAQSSDNLTSVFGQMANSALAAVTNMTTAMANNSAQIVQNSNSGQVQKYAADLSARTQMSITQANNQMQKYVADIQSLTSKQVARIAADANVSTALINQLTSQYSAELAYDASVLGSVMTNNTSNRNNIRNNSTTLQKTKMDNRNLQENTVISGILGILGGFTGALTRH